MNETPPAEPTTPPTEPPKPEAPPPVVEPLTPEALTIPEGMQVDEGLRDDFLGILNNRELSPKEQANALLALQSKALTKASETNSSEWAQMQTAWQNEARNDPEIGGAALEPLLGKIAQVTKEYGSPELLGVLDLTGAGNNVHVIRFLGKIATALTEGGHVSGGPAAPAQSLADQLYPTMNRS